MRLTKLLIFLLFTCLPAGMAFAFLLFISPSSVHAQVGSTCGSYFIDGLTPAAHGPLTISSSYNILIRLDNPPGFIPWTPAGNFRLRATQPLDDPNWGISGTGADSNRGTRPLSITVPAVIPAGFGHSFSFSVTAPNIAGSYRLAYQMSEGGTLFGSECYNDLTVLAVAPPPPPPGGGGWTTITIKPPTDPVTGKPIGYTEIGSFISNVLVVLYSIAVIIVLFFLVWGAYEWMTSGGDKESVARARGRILNALIGLAVLAVSFALYQVAARFLGFNPLELIIPPPK